jgi:hypothetical protein
MKRHLAWLLAAALGLLMAACNQVVTPSSGFEAMSDHPYQVDWLGHGSDSEKCAPLSADDPRSAFEDGYIHWVFATKGASTAAGTELKVWVDGDAIAGSPFSPGHPLTANVWHFYTPFPADLMDADGNVDPDELKARLSATIYLDGAPGRPARLVISDFCPGEPTVVEEVLDVAKTAETSFKRTHHWDIAKRVETENEHVLEDGTPKIWLYTDGSGDETATWIVDVTYKGFTDSDFAVSGTITITNPAANEQTFTITSVQDNLGVGNDFDADCPVTFPHDLAPGETLECTYSAEVTADEAAEGGVNTAKVYVDHEDIEEPFLAFAGWDFDFDNPDEELYATVNVKDISDLFGEVDLGTLNAADLEEGEVTSFEYEKAFAWEDYGQEDCGSYIYHNTASIVETGQEADATLKVNVQCFIFESAWAKGGASVLEARCFQEDGFANWGWTNKITNGTHVMPLWAGAAQCDTSKGTLVGAVTVTYAGTVASAVFNLDPGILLENTAFFAGREKYPRVSRRGAFTTAPGQYSNQGPFSGNPVIWVIAHAKVGIPDPDFGP